MKAGDRLRSQVCDTEVIVVRPPNEDVVVSCGGQPMVSLDAEPSGGAVEPGHDEGTLLGKRYVIDEIGLELLCTKPGGGSLSGPDGPLSLKGAKPLPSSD